MAEHACDRKSWRFSAASSPGCKQCRLLPRLLLMTVGFFTVTYVHTTRVRMQMRSCHTHRHVCVSCGAGTPFGVLYMERVLQQIYKHWLRDSSIILPPSRPVKQCWFLPLPPKAMLKDDRVYRRLGRVLAFNIALGGGGGPATIRKRILLPSFSYNRKTICLFVRILTGRRQKNLNNNAMQLGLFHICADANRFLQQCFGGRGG